MKVFISWSGERSKSLALALRDWLRPILQSVEVWMSQADIEAGDRWGKEVARELSSCNFGILCVTPENLNAPWLLFEAGALAKSLEDAKVVPLLFDLELRDISGPLAQFQAKKFDKPGLSEVVKSINASLANPVEEEIVSSLLDAMWPGLQTKVEAVPKRVGDTKKGRSQADILEELVLGVRGFDARLREAESNLNETGPRVRHRRTRFLMEMVDYAFMETEGQDPLGLLLVAAILREDLPAISELLNEGYRNIRLGRGNVLHHLPEQIHKLTRMMLSGPFIQEATNGSKDAHVILMELPRMIDRYLARIAPKVRRSANSSTDAAPGA